MDYSNILSEFILKEIESLPGEFREKSEEVGNLQKELNETKSKCINKENEMNKLIMEITSLENDLMYNFDEINNIKSSQKIIISELDEEAFNSFRNNFYKLDEEYYKKILYFLRYENEYEDELNFLLIKYKDLHEILRDSVHYFKSIKDYNKYQEIKNKILNNKKKNNTIKFNNNGKNALNNLNKMNKLELNKPFNIILNFIDNTFKIIDISNKINEIKSDINNKNEIKEKLYVEIKILKNTLSEKQENLNNINIYIKRMNNILIKYKNYFGNHNNININKVKDKNNDIKNTKKEKVEFENNVNNNLEKKIYYLKNNINNNNNNDNNNIFINNNKITNSNSNYSQNNFNNFYHSVNNCSKNNMILTKSSKSNSSNDNSSSNISPNNIKIISINSNTKINNSKNVINKKPIPNTPKSSKIFDRNRVNLPKSNSNENKKIKISSLPIYHSSINKNKNKIIIKTNSYDREESKKIPLYNIIPASEQNKSYRKLDEDYFLDENINEKNSTRTNPTLYHSLKLVGNNINNINMNFNQENQIKNIDGIKIINDKSNKSTKKSLENKKEIEENDKETITDYNNNILVEFKKDEINKKEINRTKKIFNSAGIYNNNRKIIKTNEKNKLTKTNK